MFGMWKCTNAIHTHNEPYGMLSDSQSRLNSQTKAADMRTSRIIQFLNRQTILIFFTPQCADEMAKQLN